MLRLVEGVPAGRDGEAGGNRPVEQVRLGKAKHDAALQVAELRGKGECLTEAEKIVRLITQADEAAGKAS